jgi:hypothetical protein
VTQVIEFAQLTGTQFSVAWSELVDQVAGPEPAIEVSETGAVWVPTSVSFTGQGVNSGLTAANGTYSLWRINSLPTQITGVANPVGVPQSGSVV